MQTTVGFLASTEPTFNRARLKGSTAIKRMAEDMREGAAVAGGVTIDDLAVRGWTAAQIAAHSANARTLAYTRAAS